MLSADRPQLKFKRLPNSKPQEHQGLRVLVRLLRCGQAVRIHFRSSLEKEYGTTLAKWDAIATLARYPDGLTMSDLSRSLMVSAGNVTQLVGRLAKEGLVVRKVQGNDRRYAKAILTKNGRAVFRDIASANERWIDQSLRYMNSADVAQLVILLKKLRQSIDRTVSDSST